MIGIDIISGFLGSGKTTFANALLKYYLNLGERPVYIVNEFGNTGLDAQIAENNGFSSIELSNGCVCCSLKHDVIVAIKEIVKTFSPTKIVFEPSGIFVFDQFADILKDEFIKMHCTINSAITIVDSITFQKVSGLAIAGSFIENQIKYADTLIVSKLEKFKGDLSDILCNLVNINSKAKIIAKPFDELEESDFGGLLAEKADINWPTLGKKHRKLSTYTVELEKAFNEETYSQFIQNLSGKLYGNVYRVKGTIKKNESLFLLNIAFDDIHLSPQSFIDDMRLTFIGPYLKTEELKMLAAL